MRMIGPRTSASASFTPSTSSGGSRLVKKLPGPMMTASNERIAPATSGMNRHLRLEPEAPHFVTARLAGIDLDLTARACAVGVLGADRRQFDGDRPHATLAPEQRAQAVHGREKVAAVALHHRQQQVAAGVAAEPIARVERRQARQQHVAGFALVARQRERALQARRPAAARRAGRAADLSCRRCRTSSRRHSRGAMGWPSIRRAGSGARCRRRHSRHSARAGASRTLYRLRSRSRVDRSTEDRRHTMAHDLDLAGRGRIAGRRSSRGVRRPLALRRRVRSSPRGRRRRSADLPGARHQPDDR